MIVAVATKPIRLVTTDSADKKVKGSKDVAVWLRLRASRGYVQDGKVIGHEERDQLATFKRLDKPLHVRQIEPIKPAHCESCPIVTG